MSNNCMVFTDKTKREVRVIFEPNGKPLFVGMDLAAIAGYKAPSKMVSRLREDRDGICTVKRKIEWQSDTKRGSVTAYCLTSQDARRLLELRPHKTDAAKWFLNTVLPEVEAIGIERSRITSNAVKHERVQTSSIMERLDAIILECALLKKELCK